MPANEVDHRLRDGVRDDDRFSNLWALCSYHHSAKTHREAGAGHREVNRRKQAAKFYEHPAFK